MSQNRRAFSEYLTRAGTPLLTPKGMGDLLPPAAAARRGLAQAVLRTLGMAGYELVTPPLFEHASIVERGNDNVDPRDLLRFVEPESGEVAVLRPDITPQVARMVATRLSDHPAPYRLCYEGRILRRRRGRARKHQQMAQVGVECIGIPTPAGDVEVIALASDACAEVGLSEHRIELGEANVIGSVLAEAPEGVRDAMAELIAVKDAAALRTLAKDRKVAPRTLERLLALLDHCGDIGVLKSARKHFKWESARAALGNLQDIVERLDALGLGDRLGIDLSEARGLSYYSGVSFQLLAEGPGEAICSGGRYDNLLGRFGRAYPATGFALDLENLQWALRAAGHAFTVQVPPRVLVLGPSDNDSERIARELRAHGVGAAPSTTQNRKAALAFASQWSYDAVLVCNAQGYRALRTRREADSIRREAESMKANATDGSTSTEGSKLASGGQHTFKQLDAAAVSALAAWAQAKED